MKQIAFVSTKGGVGKSNLCRFVGDFLSKDHAVSVYNLDDQKHVETVQVDNSDFVLFDSMGALHGLTLEMLQSFKDDQDCLIIVPVGSGQSDQAEYEWMKERLTEHGVIDQSVFVLTKVKARVRSTTEAKEHLKSLGLRVAKATISDLEDYAQWRSTSRTTSEISRLCHEVIL